MNFCIPKDKVELIKKAIADITPKALYDMPSEARHKFFAQHTTDDLASALNASFDKAKLSKKNGQVLKWFEAVGKEEKVKPDVYKKSLDKIKKLEEMGALDPDSANGYAPDLVAETLGVKIDLDEVKGIADRAKKLEELAGTIADDPTANDTYWIARKEMDDYINSINPTHQLKVATSTIGRGTMLFSAKSPLTNIVSNTVQAGLTSMERRISSNTYSGLNGDFVKQYVKRVRDIYQKSGYDISRLDAEWMGQKRLGEDVTSAQGPGAIRSIGRWYEDVVFKQLMGAPDVFASSYAFADSADLMTTKMAQMEGLTGDVAKARALEIFKDAIRIEPKTPEGILARQQSIADARFSTYTDKSGYSDVAMGIRKVLNDASGDLRLGDQLMPFVKTPAQVVSASIDNAGMGLVKGVYKGLKAYKSGDKQLMREASRDAVRGGIGLTLAAAIAYTINPDDFVGDYDLLSPQEKQMAQMENAPYNSVKINGKWVSLDYFGPLAAPVIGIMYARKYGKDNPLWSYARGAGSQLFRMPGFTEVKDIYDSIQTAALSSDPNDITKSAGDELISFISSRVVPGIVSDLARGFDSTERQTGKDIWSKTKAKIPGLRQQLPEKVSQVTGETIPTEGLLSTLLFGSRVKTAKDNAVVKEIDRLIGVGNAPAILDIERSSAKVRAMKESMSGMDFQEALKFYGTTYGSKVTALMDNPDYADMSDEEKKKALNSIRADAMDAMLLKFSPNLTAKEKIKKDLQPYLDLEDLVWSQQPYELRYAYKQILDYEKMGDTTRAKALLQRFPQILNIRKQIALAKKNLRTTDPRVRAAYEATYGKQSIWE